MNDINPTKDWPAWFAERTDIDANGCQVWRHGKSKDGYGKTKHYRHGKSVAWRVHRLAYVALRGPIPDGMTVDHLCFNRACCNPDHLRLLSNEENASRQIKSLMTTCSYGHKYDAANTVMRRNGAKWRRRCAKCLAASEQRRQRSRRVLDGAA